MCECDRVLTYLLSDEGPSLKKMNFSDILSHSQRSLLKIFSKLAPSIRDVTSVNINALKPTCPASLLKIYSKG